MEECTLSQNKQLIPRERKILLLRQLFGTLSPALKRRFVITTFLRVLAVSLEIVGLALIADLTQFAVDQDSALVATFLSQFFDNTIAIWVQGMAAIATLLARSAIAFSSARQLTKAGAEADAELTGRASRMVLGDYDMTIAGDFQTALTLLPSSASKVLLSLASLISDGALALAIVLFVVGTNPVLGSVAALMSIGAAVLLQRALLKRTKQAAEHAATEFNKVSDFGNTAFSQRDELLTSGQMSSLLHNIQSSKRNHALAEGQKFILQQVPRYFLEALMILGILSIFGYYVVFSDIASNAGAIAAITLGGLRLAGSIPPIQNALQTISAGLVNIKMLPKSAFGEQPLESEQGPLPLGTASKRVVETKSLVIGYQRDRSNLVEIEVDDLVIEKGDRVRVSGPSGSGKTTLVRSLLGLQVPLDGTLLTFGQILHPSSYLTYRIPLAYVSQRTVLTLEMAELLRHRVEKDPELKKLLSVWPCESLLEGLREGRLAPKHLSGGESQILAISFAISQKPQLLVIDEGSSGMDSRLRKDFTNLLLGLGGDLTLIYISHEKDSLPTGNVEIRIAGKRARFKRTSKSSA